MASPVPRLDEDPVLLLSTLGIPINRLDPTPDAPGSDFLAVFEASMALREPDQIHGRIELEQ